MYYHSIPVWRFARSWGGLMAPPPINRLDSLFLDKLLGFEATTGKGPKKKKHTKKWVSSLQTHERRRVSRLMHVLRRGSRVVLVRGCGANYYFVAKYYISTPPIYTSVRPPSIYTPVHPPSIYTHVHPPSIYTSVHLRYTHIRPPSPLDY